MSRPFTRRDFLKSVGASTVASVAPATPTAAAPANHARRGWIVGKMTGSQALVQALLLEGAGCVFGIPGAQENELWDAMKAGGIDYMLVTHEFSASIMADGYARSTGRPGVMCVVPGPGLTNSLTGIGEALLDSVPMVCLVGDVARGKGYRPFQVHDLPQTDILKHVTKDVFEARCVQDIPHMVRHAFALACAGEPGPVGVVLPYPLLMETAKIECPPVCIEPPPFPIREAEHSLDLLAHPQLRVGIYAGMGCTDASPLLTEVAEMLQAPVATSVSGKGVISDKHPLAVGYGYGPHGTRTAEQVFKDVDVVLAIGVKYSEVSTAFYAIPKHPYVIHVDINPDNLGKVVPACLKLACDSSEYLGFLLANRDRLCRPTDTQLQRRICKLREADKLRHVKHTVKKCTDPVGLLTTLRRAIHPDAMVFMDVSMVEHWAAETFESYAPRTYFNPTDNQAMGWSIPAALGAQRAFPNRQTVAITGDGCFLMSAMELSTAAREGLPIKVFILDNQCYQYMQVIQKPAYLQTTATILAHLDYGALAAGMGLNYMQIHCNQELGPAVEQALCTPGPVLVRVVTDFAKRPCRWIDAVSNRFVDELSSQQKIRFLARIGSRALDFQKHDD